MTGDLWEVRAWPGGLSLELRGDPPGVVIVQGSDRVRLELGDVRSVIAAMGDAAADLAGLLAVIVLVLFQESFWAKISLW